ncbi:MAG: dihydrolipoyl dehydrogenase [Paludibacteraceae bacterium]|nr:dihydrolipoyl dehydrogenase [Paludibacteraceae bacterium]
MFNLAIIGGGPAGYTAAAEASEAGMKVVLFERDTLGGTCLNVGCIPTKTLLYSAKQYFNATNASKYGVSADNVSFDYQKMQQRKQKVVRKLVAGVRQKLRNGNCTVVAGEASVLSRTDEKVVIECNGEQYEAENLMICTGSQNFVPPIPGVKDNPYVWNSTDALDSKELPADILIVGGGVIGMEFATLYHELGVNVTDVEAMPSVLPNLDKDCVGVLLEKYRKLGVRILTSTKVKSLEENRVIIQTEEGEETLTADKVLICVGRRANLAGLEALQGLEIERGAVKVNDFMQTNLRNVYAAGDVTGKIMLAHVASRQAEVAVGRMLKQIPLQRIAYNAIPSVVYTNPEIASVGLTEADLTGAECVLPIEYEAKVLPMAFSGRFVAENEGENGLCKVIIDKKNQTLLGVHMVGNPCSEFVAAASFAVRMGYTVSEFKQVVFPHPTVSEILRETVI